MMSSELVDAWRASNAKNLLLLDSLAKEALANQYSPRTRTVAAQFAHMHNVRVSHLEKLGPGFLDDLEGFPRGAQPSKKTLRSALVASAAAIAKFLEQCERSGKVKGWSGSPTTYLSYFIAHEAHHRGLVMVAMRISGTKVSKDIAYGMWYWRDNQTGS